MPSISFETFLLFFYVRSQRRCSLGRKFFWVFSVFIKLGRFSIFFIFSLLLLFFGFLFLSSVSSYLFFPSF